MKPAKTVNLPDAKMYVTWEKGDSRAKALALSQHGESLRRVEPILRTKGSNIFNDIAPGNVSIRDGFTRDDYEPFRLDEQIPKRAKDIILRCMKSYEQIGIVKNVIDLMADFASQGVRPIHPNERIQKWWEEWWRRVNGKERSERFLNLFYRTGNVIVKRQTAKLSVKVEEQMKRAQGDQYGNEGPDVEIPEEPKLAKREIPWKYVFYNPLSIEVLGEELATFVGQDAYAFAVRIPETLIKKIKTPKPHEEQLVQMIPAAVRNMILAGKKAIPLDPTKTLSFYYKKDDWQLWAHPMVYAILTDLNMLQKMKLADLAALDGAISCIRVWKLGDIENGILPTDVAINRLAEMLQNNVGGGVMDLVWGPELQLVETSTEVYRFLGQTKYEPVLTAVYAGLGIPPTLTGASTQSGFTNNYISLKTLSERLQYGRDALSAFWENEIRIVQKQMGFRFPAKLVYDHVSFTDENAEKALLIQLFDRVGISMEALQERFGEDPDIEAVRIRREERRRKNGNMPTRAGPYHTDQKHDLAKQFVGSGSVAPSQVGLELKDKTPGEQTPAQHKAKVAPKPVAPVSSAQPKGKSGQGRPKNAKDSSKRQQKKVNPRTSAVFFETMARVENAQARINQLVSPAYLKTVGKKTLRELTNDESRDFEAFKFAVLCNADMEQPITEKVIGTLAGQPLLVPDQVQKVVQAAIAKHIEKQGKEPTMDIVRRFQAGAYAMWIGEFDEACDSADGVS